MTCITTRIHRIESHRDDTEQRNRHAAGRQETRVLVGATFSCPWAKHVHRVPGDLASLMDSKFVVHPARTGEEFLNFAS